MIFYRRFIILLLPLLFLTIGYAQENGFREVQLTHNNSDNRYASYNKSGDRIVFETNRDGRWQIYTMDIDGNDQQPLVVSMANDRRPSWHPYKDIIIFDSDRSGTNEIYKVNLSSMKVSKIPFDLSGNKTYAHFAPNGVELVFCLEEKQNDFDLYKATIRGKAIKKLFDNKFMSTYPHFSPRGDVIVYHSDKNLQGDTNIIYTYNIVTEEGSRLTYFKDDSYQPMWSNKRDKVAFVHVEKDGSPEIYSMRPDGTRKTRITFNDADDALPNWSPNDINLLITGKRNGNYHICKILLKEPL